MSSFLQLPGIVGESHDAKHRGWIPIESATHQKSTSEKVSAPHTVTVIKTRDGSSASLRRALDDGKRFASATIESVGADRTTRIVLEGAIIAEMIQSAGDAPEYLTLSVERLSFEDASANAGTGEKTPPASAKSKSREVTAPVGRQARSTPAWQRSAHAAPVAAPQNYPVMRAVDSAASAMSTIVLRVRTPYTLSGRVLSRVAWAVAAADAAIVTRDGQPADDRVLPIGGVRIELREGGAVAEPDDRPFAQAVTAADGTFEFTRLLDTGVDYELVAVFRNERQKLLEERVTIRTIRLDSLPRPASSSNMKLTHRNQGGATANVADESEQIIASVNSEKSGDTTVSLDGAAAILLNTLLLDVPYINQNRNADGTRKALNIDGIGEVSGGILCFPTSVAMVARFHGLAAGASTEQVAEVAYRNWQAQSFPHRESADGLERYHFTYGNDSGGNVWEWWLWENRAARELAGLPLASRWHPTTNDDDGVDALPADGAWAVHWDESNLLAADSAAYVRRHIGRGWPLVVGTNLTGAGHIIVVRGIVVRNDGSIHKLIVNNPWGQPGENEARALYYDSRTTGQTNAALRLHNHLAMRHGVPRATVLRDKIVTGDAIGRATTSVPLPESASPAM